MNTQVSFKIAKLLKEKGFDSKVRGIYCIKAITPFREGRSYLSGYGIDENFIYAPTIAEVVMWLYKKHSLWIIIIPTVTGNFAYKVIDVQLNPEKVIERPPYKDVSAEDFSEPTDAYLGAIEDILNNLI